MWGIVEYCCDHLDGLYTYKSRSRTFELPIWRNTIDENGIVSLMVPGAVAKKERILKLQQHQQQNQHNNFVVYVADSTTYLLALIQADVGILLKVFTDSVFVIYEYY